MRLLKFHNKARDRQAAQNRITLEALMSETSGPEDSAQGRPGGTELAGLERTLEPLPILVGRTSLSRRGRIKETPS